ncbi:helix-turn-helix transcriptional regulator [Chitinophaga solisilvae]|uniref:YafY family transcriptional regulator n=1 Tax=Chitinophaga solisilvae TaxID=1233460 RepID=A0A3S1CUI9_9BACT|nr:YafY family protein [Chitinophaga solisilvae]NSL85341.1 YafY family transcriptional regulator [Chitinophaga solisilvae]
MHDNETSRLARLTAILTHLQTKRLITATELAAKFGVSVRTIYRDIRSLEQSGVPVLTEEGKGYMLMEGYRIPPVTFSESEANALITAEQLVIKNRDASFVKEYSAAVEKIKAVLRYTTRENADLLSGRVAFAQNAGYDRTSNYLSSLQLALTNFNLIHIMYQSTENSKPTERIAEPFALLSTQENWLLVAWCRLRKDYRHFRLDRIQQLQVLSDKFEPHKISLQEYFKYSEKNSTHP